MSKFWTKIQETGSQAFIKSYITMFVAKHLHRLIKHV